MHRILIAAMVAIGVLAVMFIPNRSADELLVEKSLLGMCLTASPRNMGPQVSPGQMDTLCRCATPMAVKALGSDVAKFKDRLKDVDSLPPEVMSAMNRQLQSCMARHQ